MKKRINSILVLCMIGSLLGACGTKNEPAETNPAQPAEETAGENIETEAAVEESAEVPTEEAVSELTPVEFAEAEDIMEKVSDLDLYHSMNTEGLHSETETDEENDTAIIRWYDDSDTLVYMDYEGYGEDAFTWITELNDGTPAEVMYWNEGPELCSAWVKTVGCSISFNQLNPDMTYGAESVCVVQEEESKRLYSDYKVSEFIEGQWMDTVYGRYTEDGFIEEHSYAEDGELVQYTETRAARKPAPAGLGIPEDFEKNEAGGYFFECGSHTLYYTDTPDGQWYVTLKLEYDINNEEESYQTLAVDLPIASDCIGTDNLTASEYDEYYCRTLILNEKGEIAEIR